MNINWRQSIGLIVLTGVALGLPSRVPLTTIKKQYSVKVTPTEYNMHNNRTYGVYSFPQIKLTSTNALEGAHIKRINALIKIDSKVAEKASEDSNYELKGTAVFNSSQLLSVNFFFLIDGFGAHFNHGAFVKHYDLRTGKRMHLKDFFVGDYKKAIGAYINTKAARPKCKMGDWPIKMSKEGWFTPTGLTLTYDPYALCGFSSGQVDIKVPKAVLLPVMSKAMVARVF